MRYSSELIRELMQYMLTEYNLEISEEQAERYLDSLAMFYEVISKNEKTI